MCLLFKEVRAIFQIDITYYNNEETKKCIDRFLCFCDKQIIKYRDTQENIVVYLKKNQEKVERKLVRIGNGFIVNALCKASFADILDPIFYQSKGKLPDIFYKKRVVQVSINIVNEKSCGAILIQMCEVKIGRYIKALYKHFHYLSKCIEEIDPDLQTTLTFHTKPGLWKESPELVSRQYYKLNHI
tara:strand:+ start:7415 stop:7972 length:558 start_codon:yes stop_codon:yes gene_type:complete